MVLVDFDQVMIVPLCKISARIFSQIQWYKEASSGKFLLWLWAHKCRVIVKQGIPTRIVSSLGWSIWVHMVLRLASASTSVALPNSAWKRAPTELG